MFKRFLSWLQNTLLRVHHEYEYNTDAEYMSGWWAYIHGENFQLDRSQEWYAGWHDAVLSQRYE